MREAHLLHHPPASKPTEASSTLNLYLRQALRPLKLVNANGGKLPYAVCCDAIRGKRCAMLYGDLTGGMGGTSTGGVGRA